ncbi:hypothetical protein LTR84_005128 [Exophiala bonariae]|uniref:Xylanolytic transcriptional activator regulatory domain-containing protein n=1 Tax=Exophiala bonariae TaxID=1690606 RepID=A0AAV9NPC6_9EURO|nr:hypothetical protein LTR84_005128 [Exophiala bonariae]
MALNSYVHSLEERVAYLELQLRQHGINEREIETAEKATPPSVVSTQQPPRPPSHSLQEAMLTHNASALDAQTTADKVIDLSARRPQDESTFSRILLAELMNLKQKPSVRAQDPFATAEHVMISGLDTSPVSLPTKEAAQTLIKSYFQFANLSLPLLHEPTFVQKLDLLYNMSNVVDLNNVHTTTEARIAVFFVFEVFAVALLTIQKQDPSRIPASLADRYHRAAVRALNEAGLPSDVEGVQALLLVGQYCYHHPTVWAVWKTVGAALRLAVELGLHREPTLDKVDPLTLDTMRRSFWVAYAMDRNISIALTMPSCLSDGAITAQFPSQAEDDNITSNGIVEGADSPFKAKCISHHVFRYRQIQSEMQTVLNEKPFPIRAPGDLSQWQSAMHRRIQTWYEDTPRNDDVGTRERRILENFELTFHRALFYLYQPSLNIPEPPEMSLLLMAEAAIKMIELYRQFFRDHRLTIYWQAVENLSSAGTALMFSYVSSPRVQERLTLRSLESLINICSSVLWGMVEHFPDFKGKRDAFDLTASKVLADLSPSNHSMGTAPAQVHNNEGYIDFAPSISYSSVPTFVVEGANDSRMTASSGIRGPMIQHGGIEPTPHGSASEVEFSLPDFNEIAFDWETFQTTNEFLVPAWT